MAETSYMAVDEIEDDDPTAELEVLPADVLLGDGEGQPADADSDAESIAAANQPFDNDQVDAELRGANQKISELSSELDLRTDMMQSVELELDRLREISEFLEKEVESGKEMISSVTDELDSVRSEQIDVTERLRYRDRQIDVLRGKLAAREAFIDEITREIDEAGAAGDDDDHEANGAPVVLQNAAPRTPDREPDAWRKRLRMLVATADGEPIRYPILAGRMTLGTGPENDVCLNDRFVSYRHAEITETATGCILKDLGSSNGTWINGRRVKWQVLRHGDLVDIGPLRFEFVDRPVEVVEVSTETGTD